MRKGCVSWLILAFIIITLILPTTSFGQSLEDFVLFGLDSVHLNSGVVVDSGAVGSNGRTLLDRGSRSAADIFGNSVTLSRDVTVKGDVYFNSLSANGATINGKRISPLAIPMLNLPSVPLIPVGSEDVVIAAYTAATVNPGTFRNITIGRGAAVNLAGGTYNAQTLIVGAEADVNFMAPTTINIQNKLDVGANANLTGASVGASKVTVNYAGTSNVVIGQKTILHARVYAPYSVLILDKLGGYRGRFAAKSVEVGAGATLGVDDAFSRPSDPAMIVQDENGARFPVNEIIVMLAREGTRTDADEVAAFVDGTIVGVVPSINLYKILVPTSTINQLDDIIETLKALENPVVEAVLKNFAMSYAGNFSGLNTDMDNLDAFPISPNRTLAYKKAIIASVSG